MCNKLIISTNKKNSIIIHIYLYISLCPHISNDIVYMLCIARFYILYALHAATNEKGVMVVAHVREKYVLQFGCSVLQCVSGMVRCETMQK